MYEKYSGLPDTTKSTHSNGSRPAERSVTRAQSSGQMEYYQAPNRAASQASAKRASARRAKARKRKMILAGMSLGFLALITVAVLVLVKSCSTPAPVDLATDTFRNGVTINGMDVSGKTIAEVTPQLEANESTMLERIAITLSSAEISAVITGPEMDASSNLNEVIEQALSGGANQNYSTVISFNEAALSSRIDEINQTTSKPPVDASATMDFSSSGKPVPQYIEGTPGFGLDVASTVEMVRQAMEAGQYQTTLTPTMTAIQPSITVADIQANFTEIGSFTTTYDYKGTAEDTEAQRIIIPDRAFNVEKAANAINKQVVKPGAKWSFNDVVGDRTQKNGWKEANGIFGGDKLTLQFGGGVCQVSTTLYNAVLKAYPYIKIVERQRHSIPSTYVDMGLDATVDTGHIDFIFQNTSDHPLYIYSYYANNKMAKSRKRDLTVVIYGKALPEGHVYKTRTVVVSEEAPGAEEITESKTLFIGEERILAEARSKFIVQIFIDHYINGEVVEQLYFGEDTYPGNPLRKQIGIKPTPTPEPTATPTPTPSNSSTTENN
jgi:vancomycin resistance protein YoaR